MLPVSGSEPRWEPEKWNSVGAAAAGNNCYAYALDNFDPARVVKPLPGRGPEDESVAWSCASLESQMIQDLGPMIQPSVAQQRCPTGYSKIYALSTVTDQSLLPPLPTIQGNDFHYIRQDHDGYWSHKLGSNGPTRFDFAGRFIVNPENSDFGPDYVNRCGFYCVQKDASRSVLLD